MSRNELPPSEDHRKTNSCVRATSFSSKTSDICFSLWGWSKTSRIVSVPGIAARQPGVSPETNADSIGESLSSDVTSTTAARLRSSQPSPPDGTVPGVRVMSRGTRAAEYVQRIDRIPVATTLKRNQALVMGKLTAEDVVNSLGNSRCIPELVPVQVTE